MNRQINRVTAGLIFLMLALIANLSFVQVFKAKDYRNAAGNQRVLRAEYSRERGPMLLGSKTIAESVPTKDTLKFLRTYANGPEYAPITGYYSVVYGASALELQENDVLSGNDSRFFVDRLQQLIAGRKPKGGAIRLSINAAAQTAAYKALNGRTGAVVALDPQTGAILAMATSPSYDPNTLSSHDPQTIQQTWDVLNKDTDKPMLDRPLAMTLPPGSTFKLVTAAAALESGNYTASSSLPGPAQMKLPLTDRTLGNWTGSSCGKNDKVTLEEALAISCNTAFAYLGMQLGSDALETQAKKFGFESSFDVPMTAATSHFPSHLDAPQTAMSAIGQYDVRATALQMAMVAAGIANDGVVMKPYLVSQVLGPDLTILQNTTPSAFSRAMSSENAAILRDMMINVVAHGTGSNARIPGIKVGGKTGTAENTPGESAHAWFVGIAPGDNPSVAVAVVLEHGGGATEVSGNALAAPIAARVMRAVLDR